MTLSEFFNMGGYAFYVWTSYASAGVILLANVLVPLLNARKQRRELIGKLRREGRG
jgi:heme exporter protein D